MRELQNIPGAEYDAEKLDTIFAEDWNDLKSTIETMQSAIDALGGGGGVSMAQLFVPEDTSLTANTTITTTTRFSNITGFSNSSGIISLPAGTYRFQLFFGVYADSGDILLKEGSTVHARTSYTKSDSSDPGGATGVFDTIVTFGSPVDLNLVNGSETFTLRYSNAENPSVDGICFNITKIG